MNEDRRNWTVKKFSSFAEADEAEDKYYASLTEVERLEILIGLRAQVVHKMKGIEKIVLKKTIHEPED